MLKQSLIHFLKLESAVGILLIIAMGLAMILANSPYHTVYSDLMDTPVMVMIGTFQIAKPLLLWINDGLMAVFFFMVGLEIKREIVEGTLKDRSKLMVPLMAALGGMLVPAAIYSYINWDNGAAMQGWAIPMATDIAFALGILSLLGSRVPTELKLFLLTLAVIDDLGAIIVIALFYTSEMSLTSLIVSAVMIGVLLYMNRKGVVNNTAYILIGLILWTAVLKSGVHATLAGVILGLMIPIQNNRASFHHLEHSLHAPVNFVILPLFAFANTGIVFGSITAKDFTDTMTLGIVAGLFFGKQIGVFFFAWLGMKLQGKALYEGVKLGHIYGVALLSGIGFTMSLFIGSLAFECSEGVCFDLVDERMGILVGSFLSALGGYLVLKWQLGKS